MSNNRKLDLGIKGTSFGFLFLFLYFLHNEIRVFVSDDAYFYLVTARNIVLEGEHSFSGIFPSNGFHPLWLYLLAAWGYIAALINPAWLSNPYFPLPVSLLLIAGAIVNFRQVAVRLNISSNIFIILPALYLTIFGVLYSEAHTLYFCLSLLWRLALSEKLKGQMYRPFVLGIAVFLVFFSRLDTIFFAVAFYGWLWNEEKNIQPVLKALIPPIILGSIYLGFNQVYFGGLSPVSGWLKSSFPVPTFSGFDDQGGLPLILSGYSIPFGWLPILLSFVAYALLRNQLPHQSKVLLCIAIGALGHGLYVAAFTTGHTYWYWYYVLPILAAATALALLADAYLKSTSLSKLIVIGMLLGGIGVLLTSKQGGDPSPQTYWLMELVEKYKIRNKTIFVSEHPGYVAFYSENRILAADMLTGNRHLFEKLMISNNALITLFEKAEASGHPVDYVVWVGGHFLNLDEDQRTLSYPSPKYPNPHVGDMIMPDVPLEMNEKGYTIWKIR